MYGPSDGPAPTYFLREPHMRIILVPTNLDLGGIPAAVVLSGPHHWGKTPGNIK